MALDPEVRLERFLAGQNLTPAVRLEYFLAGAAGYGLAALQNESPVIAAGGTAEATVPDAAESVPLQSLVVAVNPVQEGEGTPAPDNERPIVENKTINVRQVGKNRLILSADSADLNGVNFAVDKEAGTVTVNGTAVNLNADFYFNGDQNGAYQYSGIPSGNYVLTGSSIGSQTCVIFIVRDDGTVIAQQDNNNPVSITIDDTRKYRIFARVSLGKSPSNVVLKPMIRAAGTSDSFEPYRENIYTAKLPAGFYAGDANVVKGIANSYYRLIDLGSLSWALNNITVGGNPAKLYRSSSLPDSALTYNSTDMVCECYETAQSTGRSELTISVGSGDGAVDIIDSNYTNAKEFQAAMAGKMLLYKVTNTEVISFDPAAILTLKGVNNFSADSGNILAIEYKQDPEAAANEIKAIIAPVLPEMKADANLVANDFRIVGNTLYKITANIAAGGTLTPGNNCTATSVAAQLKALL